MTIVETIEIKYNLETKEISRTRYTVYVEPMIRQLVELRNQGIDLFPDPPCEEYDSYDVSE